MENINQDMQNEMVSLIDTIINMKDTEKKAARIRDIVPIEQWINDEYYVGPDALSIYPYWKQHIINIFNSPVRINEVILTGGLGTGKSLPLDTNVLTINGYVKMRDIKVGDILVDGTGNATRVLGVYPQGVQPTYKITFSDKSSIECSADHIWKVLEKTHSYKERTYTTEELINKGIRKSNGWRFRLPTPTFRCWEDYNIKIDSYLLGVLIGDGSFSNNFSISLYESDIKDKIESILGNLGYKLNLISSDTKDYRITLIENHCNQYGSNNVLKDYLMKEGLLCKSIHKHIPKNYLYSSVETRTKLLQGLFDTDGYIDKSGISQFSTSSEQLSKDFSFLVRSLGGTDTVSEKIPTYTYNNECKVGHKTYIHTIKFDVGFEFCTSAKHKLRIKKRQFGAYRRIVNIEKVEDKESQCLMVDSPDHTFIVENEIVTHNTTIANIILLRKIYELSCYKNIPALFNLMTSSKIMLAYFNLNLGQALLTGYGQLKEMIDNCPYFQEHFSRNNKKDSEITWPQANMMVRFASGTQHTIGTNLIGSVLDEANFFSKTEKITEANMVVQDKAKKIYTETRNRRKIPFYGKWRESIY